MTSLQAPPRPVTPLGILAAELDKISELLDGTAVDPALRARLRRAVELAAGLDPYVERCTSPESAALAGLTHRTQAQAWGSGLEQEMLSGHVEGKLLQFLVRMTRAERVLEIGMFTGYSALAMAEALPAHGTVDACEIDAEVAAFAQESFAQTPAGAKITVHVGPALETLRTLRGRFDLVFIDADKAGYTGYLDALLASDLLAPGALVAVDNTLMQGQPWTSLPLTPNGEAISAFNARVAADARVEQVLIPVRDGLTLIRRV